jgi:hypothetical protein
MSRNKEKWSDLSANKRRRLQREIAARRAAIVQCVKVKSIQQLAINYPTTQEIDR